MKIWSDKLSVTIVAALSAALVYYVGWWRIFQKDPVPYVMIAGSTFITSIGSAMYWTLLGRSTIAGLILNLTIPGLFLGVGIGIATWIFGLRMEMLVTSSIPVLPSAALCYAGFMLWLGRRKLARFQFTGGVAAGDLLVSGPDVVPEALAGLLRSHPTGALQNLIRKELRLLRPLWLWTAVGVFFSTLLIITRFVPEEVALAMFSLSAILVPVLAGSLSLGEEKTMKTQSWQMTLPVSIRGQWLIKLATAVLAGLLCALSAALPLIVYRSIFGSALLGRYAPYAPEFLLLAALMSVFAFWCSCAVNSTIHAVLWYFPATLLVFLAGYVGYVVLPTPLSLLDSGVSRFHPYPFHPYPFIDTVSFRFSEVFARSWTLIPAALVAVAQSYRLFRREAQESIRSAVRYLLPLLIVEFFFGFSLQVISDLRSRPFVQVQTVLRETHAAVEQLRPDLTTLDAAHPLQVTIQDLSKVSPLSDLTRHWLSNSSIAVAPPDLKFVWKPRQPDSKYSATIRLPQGWACTTYGSDLWGCKSTAGGEWMFSNIVP